MIHITTDQLFIWINSFIWPLTRILGLIAFAPVFGNVAIPPTIKISFGVVLALIVAPTLGNLPTVDPISLPAILILGEQFLIGVAMGFTMRPTTGAISSMLSDILCCVSGTFISLEIIVIALNKVKKKALSISSCSRQRAFQSRAFGSNAS